MHFSLFIFHIPMPYCYKYPRPMVTVDILLLRRVGGELQVLLIRRDKAPFRGSWALPGGYVHQNESLETAARRELQEETGLENIPLRQLRAYGDPGRDPRGHTITIVYGGVVEADTSVQPVAGSDADQVQWFPAEQLPELAFDHTRIIAECLGEFRDSPG